MAATISRVMLKLPPGVLSAITRQVAPTDSARPMAREMYDCTTGVTGPLTSMR